ncbi:MAG: acyltransferase [Ferruginibacter sp.]
MQERIHLKGLNGIRAIAAISVVIAHTRVPEFNLSYDLPAGLANYAVTIFFALSGFLITYLLFTEKNRTGINIKKFYIRRILRIWPLYFAYLLAAVLTIYFYNPGTLPGSLPYYLFFAANIPSLLESHLPYLSHYWSLGVEEQFYLFWPWIIKKADRVLRALIIFTIGFILLKLVFHFIYFHWKNDNPLYINSILRFECMSLGGIAALLCLQGHRLFLKVVTHKVTEIVCWLSLLAMMLNKFFIYPLINLDMAALVAIGLIVNLGFNKKPLISLENHFFDLLGRLSYGIYIIHPLVIFYYALVLKHFNIGTVAKPIVVYGGTILLTITIAWLSYEFFEKKFLRLKDKFSTVKNSDSKYT